MLTATKLKVSLVALNPHGEHCSSLYLLKAFAEQELEIANSVDFQLFFFDSLIPPQSNELDVILRKIIDSKSDVIAFSCYVWNVNEVMKLIEMIKMIKPEKKIIVGGPEVTGRVQYYIEQYSQIDYIVKGEGELAFKQFLQYCLGKLPIENVSNLVYRQNSRIIFNNEVLVESLESIPRIFSNNIIDVNKLGDNFYSFETRRGCIYRCSFCFYHKGVHFYRDYPLEHVKQELTVLLNSNLRYIWVIDPVFNEPEERALEIVKFISENNKNNISFGFELRNETLTETFIKELSKITSIKFIAMGLQTINRKALVATHRGFDKKKYEYNLSLIKEYFPPHVRIHIDLIYGLPMDTLQDYKSGIDYALSLGGMVYTQPLKVLPGTSLEKDKDKYGIKVEPHPPYEVLYNDTFSYEEMCQAKKINVALYLYQSNKHLQFLFQTIVENTNESISNVFEQVGDYLWENEYYEFFQNYREFSLGYLISIVLESFSKIYNINLSSVSEKQQMCKEEIIKIDWGSVAPTQFYR